MTNNEFDFAIIGSGFGGSLLALILRRLDYRVVVVDRVKHPRFAIGESSTPLADSILKQLCLRYQLPKIASLCSYGTARLHLPDVTVGLKRGFSYFSHEIGKPFAAAADNCEQLVVAASANDELSDTHWLRSDVDAFFATQLATVGIELRDQTEILSIERTDRWQIETRASEPYNDNSIQEITADFVVDASGRAGVLLEALGIGKSTEKFQTDSRALYAHFRGATPWHDLFVDAGGDATRHPFRCDRAAVHQLIDGGWMWQLGFDNGVMSAGFALDRKAHESRENEAPMEQWNGLLKEYPSLAEQFRGASIVAPTQGMVATGRMQFLADQLSGNGWTLVPATAGFVDPLHSTGIAHTLAAIERLAVIFSRHRPGSPFLSVELADYASRIRSELLHIDQLVSCCYQTLDRFDNFTAATMLYFAAAIFSEHQRSENPNVIPDTFLLADDERFENIFAQAQTFLRSESSLKASENSFPRLVRSLIQPYNLAGLCDQSVQNMYRYTAAPEKSS